MCRHVIVADAIVLHPEWDLYIKFVANGYIINLRADCNWNVRAIAIASKQSPSFGN